MLVGGSGIGRFAGYRRSRPHPVFSHSRKGTFSQHCLLMLYAVDIRLLNRKACTHRLSCRKQSCSAKPRKTMQAGNIRDAVGAPHHERVRSASMGIANAPSRTDDAAFRAAAVADTRIRAPAVENMTFADLTVATPPSTHGAARESIPRGNTFKRHRGRACAFGRPPPMHARARELRIGRKTVTDRSQAPWRPRWEPDPHTRNPQGSHWW